jgi:hypothetical protein
MVWPGRRQQTFGVQAYGLFLYVKNCLARWINVASSDSCLHHCAVGQKVLSLMLCSVSLKYTTNRLLFYRSVPYKALTPPHFGTDKLTTNNISQQLFISALTINFRTFCSTQNHLHILTTSLHYWYQWPQCVQQDESAEWRFVENSELAEWCLRFCDSKLVNTCIANCDIFLEV